MRLRPLQKFDMKLGMFVGYDKELSNLFGVRGSEGIWEATPPHKNCTAFTFTALLTTT